MFICQRNLRVVCLALVGHIMILCISGIKADAQASSSSHVQTPSNFADRPLARSEPVTRMYRQTNNGGSQPSYVSFVTPPSEDDEDVIIKILPLPIPISVPVPAPVHVGVPAVPPFAPASYNTYNSLPALNVFSVGPQMDKRQTKQMRTKRSANADHSLISGNTDINKSHSRNHRSHISHQHPSLIVSHGTTQILTPTTGNKAPTFRTLQNQQILSPITEQIALPSAIHTVGVPAPQRAFSFGANGIPHRIQASFNHVNQQNQAAPQPLPNMLGDDPIKASFISAYSNPMLHLLSAPYLKHVKETNGEDLPTIEEVKQILERSSFGLSGFEEDLE